jgi:hypothetical protein
MKNTVKLFGLIALAVLIGFAACDDGNNSDNTDPDKPDGDITWSAIVNGEADTEDSTRITLTFSAAVTGLTADNITLTDGTGSAAKVSLQGSGAGYILNITVNTAGTVSLKVTKDGVSADAQDVTVHKKQTVNPISAGRITYINDGEQVEFSGGGTYTLKSHGNSTDENNKWIWEPKAEGSYTWDSSAQSLTLTLEKVADDGGVMTPKAGALPLFVAWISEEIENEITARLAWSTNILGETRDDAEASVLASRNEENGTAYTTLAEFISYLADIRFDEMFAVRSYTYTFSNDGESLILLDALPAPVGTDELAGKTFYGTISDWLGDSEMDPNHTFVFLSATYIETGSDGTISSTGAYSYDSTAKRVYLQPAAKNGQTPEQYYDEADYYDTFDKLSEPDSRTSQTHQHFRLWRYDYNPATNIIDTRDSGGDIEPL